MPKTKPAPGDDVLRHAHKQRVSKQAILAHPENRELFSYRDPSVLSEDDEVFVPDPVTRTLAVGTGETYYLVYKPQRRVLHVVLHDDDGKPRDADYTLSNFVYDGDKPKYGLPFPDELHGFAFQGVVHEELPVAVSELTLTMDDMPDDPIVIRLGRLDPLNSTRGLKTRLRNLGLFHGDVEDASVDAVLIEAIRMFQRTQGMAVTGAADLATRDALRGVCGG